MNILKSIDNLILEYEEIDSTITNNKKNYNLNCIFKLTEKIKPKTFKVSDLNWVLKYDKPDKDRVEKADVNVPVIISNYKNKLVAIDGLHRLQKAVNLNLDSIEGKFISSELLAKCEI
jgi:hypothetical protein